MQKTMSRRPYTTDVETAYFIVTPHCIQYPHIEHLPVPAHISAPITEPEVKLTETQLSDTQLPQISTDQCSTDHDWPVDFVKEKF